MLKKYLWLILTLAISLTIVSTAFAQGITTTTAENVSLRTGAGTDWRRITVLRAGTAVTLDGRRSDNVWVRGISSGGQVGWMAAQYLNVDPNAVGTLPVIDREAPLAVSAPSAANNTSGGGGVAGGTPTSATANVYIRQGPGLEFQRIGGLNSGEQFIVDGRNSPATWMRGIAGDGTVGWVSAAYLALTGVQGVNLQVVDPNSQFTLAAPSAPAPPSNEAVTTEAVTVNPIVSTAPVTGFSYGGHVESLDGRSVGAMQSAGMTWVKQQVRYSPGMDPQSVAGLIGAAHNNGLRILLGVIGTHPGDINQPGYFGNFAGFVGGLAGLGADAIEIWNEPNIDREWPGGQIDPGLYTQLLAESYNAIKANNGNTLVISGAPAPTGFFGGCSGAGCDDAHFVNGMAAAGAGNYMDCVGAHYNEGIVPPTQNSGDPRSEHYTRYYSGMVNTYSAAFGGSKPVCFTELGYLSPEGYGGLPANFSWAGGTSVAQHADWLGQVKRLAAGDGRVLMFIVWNVDFRHYGADPMAGYAMIRPDGSCPACVALANN